MKRETALDIICYEVAKYGKVTHKAIRLYVENRISKKAFDGATQKGFEIYQKNKGQIKDGSQFAKICLRR